MPCTTIQILPRLDVAQGARRQAGGMSRVQARAGEEFGDVGVG
jgi:hypothetical protein